mgnify:CR=1 FL=1
MDDNDENYDHYENYDSDNEKFNLIDEYNSNYDTDGVSGGGLISSTKNLAKTYEEKLAKPTAKMAKTIDSYTTTPLINTTKYAAKKYEDYIAKPAGNKAASGLKLLLKAAEARKPVTSFINNFFYGCNLIVAYCFDLLLFYTLPSNASNIPSTVSFFVKILIIIAAYGVTSILLNVLIFTVFIPLYYKRYANLYSNFNLFIKKQFKAYKNKFGIKELEERGDSVQTCILAIYSVITNDKYNNSTSIKEYKDFITDKIGKALNDTISKIRSQSVVVSNLDGTTPSTPTTPTINLPAYVQKILDDMDDNKKNEIIDYFLTMDDKFLKYVENRERFMSQSIQMWIIMLCSILFFIPIKYTFVDIVIEPKLPSPLTRTANLLGSQASNLASGISTFTKNKINSTKNMMKSNKIAPESPE